MLKHHKRETLLDYAVLLLFQRYGHTCYFHTTLSLFLLGCSQPGHSAAARGSDTPSREGLLLCAARHHDASCATVGSRRHARAGIP